MIPCSEAMKYDINPSGIVRFVRLVVVLLSLQPVFGQQIGHEGWKAGIATVKITPQEGIWMAGYASRTQGAQGKIHDLWAKAVFLSDAAGNRLVLVSSDLLGFPRAMSDRIKRNAQEKLGLKKGEILLNSSHSHSGPVLYDALEDIYPYGTEDRQKIDDYSRRLEQQVVDLIVQASEKLEPVTLSAGSGVARFQVNRRNNREADIAQLFELNGPSDHTVPVITIDGQGGVRKAVLFAYACHPTVLGGYDWSGDYAGFAQLAIEKRYPGAVALFFQGAGGDQNPLPRRTVQLATQYGKTLSAAVERVIEEGNLRQLAPAIQSAYEEVNLPFSTRPTVADLQEVVRKDGDKTYFSRWAKRLQQQLAAGQSLPATYSYPVQVLKLGEQLVFGLGGELLIDYTIGLKQKYGHETIVFGYSNDVMGYIPSKKILDEGGYEGDSSQKVYGLPSKWHPEIETLIYQTCERLVEGLE